ncbi:hypothetical protein V6N13_025345 [Hibiscus sabdariffa]
MDKSNVCPTEDAMQLQCGMGDSELENLIHPEGQNVANKKAELNNVPSCQDGLPADNHAPVIHEPNTRYHAIVQNTVSSKEHILSETAMRFLLSKRDKLFEMSLLVPPNPPFGTSFVQGCCAFEPAWNIKGRYDRIDRGILHGGNRYQD